MDYMLSSIVFSLFLAGALGYCGEYEIGQCMKPITDLRQDLNIRDDVPYFPIYTLNEEQLDQYCVSGKQSSSCFAGLSGCSREDKKLFIGFLDSFKYLCEETLEEYKSHQSCFGKSVVYQGMEACSMQANSQYESLDYTASDAKSRFCGYVTENYKCIMGVVEPECGKEAAEWQVNYVKKVISPILSLINCNALPNWAIYCLVSLGVFGLVIIVKLIAVLCLRKRKAAQARGNNVQFHNVLTMPSNTPDNMDDYNHIKPVQPPPYEDLIKA